MCLLTELFSQVSDVAHGPLVSDGIKVVMNCKFSQKPGFWWMHKMNKFLCKFERIEKYMWLLCVFPKRKQQRYYFKTGL